MAIRFAYPTINSNGLGNNLITVAKAYLISLSCQLTYQSPVWPTNIHVWPPTKNGYGYFFPTTTGDRIRLRFFDFEFRLQNKLPWRLWPNTISFTRQDYLKNGIIDVGESCLAHLNALGLADSSKPLVVTTAGMWGGYPSIVRARTWLKELLMSHEPTRLRFEAIQKRSGGKLRVAVNIKLDNYAPHRGFFEEGERVYRLPLDWYLRICRQLKETADCQIILVTDGKEEELAELIREIDPIHCIGEPRTDLLGLLLMIHSDLVVCSNSTYSRLGCFLNDRPYIWIADTLYKDTSGERGYLYQDNSALVKPAGVGSDPTPESIRRCFALSYGFSRLPEGLKRYAISNGSLPIEHQDDLFNGVPVQLL